MGGRRRLKKTQGCFLEMQASQDTLDTFLSEVFPEEKILQSVFSKPPPRQQQVQQQPVRRPFRTREAHPQVRLFQD
jgi:hypothetical protein